MQRFSRFVNLPELSALFQNVADIRVASEVPEMLAAQPRLVDAHGENKRVTVVAPPHPALKEYMAEIVQRVEDLKHVPPEVDNMLKISSDARKAALDVRMVDPKAPYNPAGKIALVATNIAEIHQAEAAGKGTQLVFLDLGTPKAKEAVRDDDAAQAADGEELTAEEERVLTNVYRTLRNELAAKGVPEDEVAFIHDYKTPEAREMLFDAVRQGDVRVLVGSTEKIGVGVNIQDRAAAAHHVDVPWRPRDVEQREGRIIRQGNKVYGPTFDEETGALLSPGRGVKIFQYVQEGSFDGFMWQSIETKARAIKSLMKRQQDNRGMDDIDPFILGVAEAKALASGNPLVKRAEELKLKVTTRRLARSAHQKQADQARMQRAALERQIADYRGILPRLERDTGHVHSLPEDAAFGAVINGKDYGKRAEAAEALEAALTQVKYNPDLTLEQPIGAYKGFTVAGVNTDQGYQLVLSHPGTQQPYHSGYIEKGDVRAGGLMSRLDNLVKGIPERANRIRENLTEAEGSLRLYKDQMQKPFGQSAELAKAEAQLRVILARLSDSTEGLRDGDDPAMDVMSDDAPRNTGSVSQETPGSASTGPAVKPREIPDIDSMTLRVAVEAERSPEAADTPGEVKEALEDALEEPARAGDKEASGQVDTPAARASWKEQGPSEEKAQTAAEQLAESAPGQPVPLTGPGRRAGEGGRGSCCPATGKSPAPRR